MSSAAPTFANNRDRITFLIAEYKLLVSGMIIGILGLVAYYQPEVSAPAWVPALLVAWLLLALPCYLVGLKIARWLRNRNWTTVHHVNAADDVIEKYNVPPQIWRDKTVEGADPYPVNGGSAWAVREYEWLDDVEELRVEGVWLEGLEDTAQYTAKSMLTDMHGWMLDQLEKLADTRAKWSRGVVEYEEETINALTEARERGVTLERETARDVFDGLAGDGEADIPKLDTDDMPAVDDLPSQDEIDQAREREDEL